MAKSDLIVVWGGNPVSTQVNVMTHVARARKERGAKLVVIDPYKTPNGCGGGSASGAAAGHRRGAGLRGDACRVPRWLRRLGVYAEVYRLPGSITGASARSRARMGLRRYRSAGRGDRNVCRAVWAHAAQLHSMWLRIHPQPQRLCGDARGDLPASGDRRLAARGRRRAVVEPQHLSLEQDADRGAGRARSVNPRARHEPDRQCADRRPR